MAVFVFLQVLVAGLPNAETRTLWRPQVEGFSPTICLCLIKNGNKIIWRHGQADLFCFAPNCKHGVANGPVKVLKSNAESLLRWKLKSNPDWGKVCQKCYNEDLRARKAAEERLAASATRSNAAALRSAGGSVQQQKHQRSREATNDSASESVDSRPTKKSKGVNNGQDDGRMMISKAEEEEEERGRGEGDTTSMLRVMTVPMI